jgi:transposase InsO family protein
MQFIEEYITERWTLTELARRHGVSRKTGYKWIERFAEDGVVGLSDRSRARLGQEHQTRPVLERQIVRTKQRYPCWGPRKILALLQRRSPEVDWPARSTVGDILRRHGLVTPRRKRRERVVSHGTALVPASEPNDLWCTDFKGFRLSGTAERLEPFTLGDAYSRYSLACHLVKATSTKEVWPVFVRCFREYGLPRRLRSDNGTPFASPGLASLSPLSVKLIRLGIRPERIAPGKPQQNGMLERFHLTLELEALSPPARTARRQQRALDQFRRRFNHVRPHEALGDRTPADVYVPSPRPYPGHLPHFEYPSYVPVRTVRGDGCIRWAGQLVFLSETLAGQRIGLHQSSDTAWSIRFGPVEVGLFNEEKRAVLRHDRLVWVEEAEDA